MPSQQLDILVALEEQSKTGHLCDVLFYNDSGSVWAHSCVLAGFSPVFDQLFSLNLENNQHWSLKQPMQITVSNTSTTKCRSDSISNCIQCLAQVVKFIYTGHLKPNALHLRHLFSLSDRLGNKELLNICERYRQKHSLLTTNEEKSDTSINAEHDEKSKQISQKNELKNGSCSGKKEPILDQDGLKESDLFDCSECNFTCKDRELFEVHGNILHCHSYKCFYCHKSYKNVPTLLHHVDIECKSERHLICSVCLFRSGSSSELASHLRKHLLSKPFSCSICQSDFDRRSVWLKHTKAHFLNVSYPCFTCGKPFRTASECSKHAKIVHKPKKHVCGSCGFTAASTDILERHQLKHRQRFTCDQKNCNFHTTSEAQLVRHRVTHRPKKPIKTDQPIECPVCQLKFTLKKNLVRHLKTHDSEKGKLKCPWCDYETWRTDKYNEHLEYKHDQIRENKDNVKKMDEKLLHLSKNSINQEITNSSVETDIVFSERVADSQNSRETFSVDSPFSKKHNTLLMNDEGDISIVNTNEKNSVTLRNIGNLTGSITLDEKTGVLTMNNINSGSVFLNETTGELTYINLENDKSRELNYHFNADSMVQGENFINSAVPKLLSEVTKLDEVTGEIIKVLPTNEDAVAPDQDFDSFEMDINEDSLDGFDEVLFDVFSGNDDEFEEQVTLLKDQSVTNTSVMPHLDESTGLLTFDENLISRVADASDDWNSTYVQTIENSSSDKEVYKLLLDEVTGVLHND